MRIGEVIAKYLQENQISQRQFAKKCGLSNGYISMLIKNTNPHSNKPIVPSLTSLFAISKALGMSLDQLFEIADDIQIDISTAKKMPPSIRNAHTEEYIQLFQCLTEEQQKMIISAIKGLLSDS